MGKIAQQNADISIITSDNPRFEKEMDIIEDILCGIDKTLDNYFVVQDREDSIKKSYRTLRSRRFNNYSWKRARELSN